MNDKENREIKQKEVSGALITKNFFLFNQIQRS